MVQAYTILGDQRGNQSGDWGLKKWRNNCSLPTVMTACISTKYLNFLSAL